MTQPVIAVTDLSVHFQETSRKIVALDNVSLEASPHEFVSVLGPSGCGKSTLLYVVAGLMPATGGEVRINGKKLAGPYTDAGVVFQRDELLAWRTVVDNVMLPVQIKGLPYAQHLEHAHRLLDKVGLSDFEKSYPHQLALISMQVMPKVAVAPILIIWFGFGILPKVILTALIAFFPIVINTIVGLRMTSKESIFLFRSMGATRTHTFFLLRLPNALPVFFGGLKISSTLATIGAVVGEFSGAEKGRGYLLTVQVGQSETAAAFGSVLYLTLLGLLVFPVVALIEHLIVPSHMLKKMGDVVI